MAVVSVSLPIDGPRGSSDGADIRVTRTWRIVVNSPNDNYLTIAAALVPGTLPQYLTPHPDNIYLTARSLSITQDSGTWEQWIAEVEYSSAPLNKQDREKFDQPNPTLRLPKIRWTSVRYDEVGTKDRDGDPYLNSAEDEYDPQDRVRDASRWNAHVTANLAIVPAWFLLVNDTLNQADILVDGIVVVAEKAKISGAEISEVLEENGFEYRQISYTLEFRKEGWTRSLLDAGFHYLDDGEKRVIEIQGERPAKEQLLDGSGSLLPVGGTPVYNDFEDYELFDLTQLPGISAAPP
jgi:hypothetical protein